MIQWYLLLFVLPSVFSGILVMPFALRLAATVKTSAANKIVFHVEQFKAQYLTGYTPYLLLSQYLGIVSGHFLLSQYLGSLSGHFLRLCILHNPPRRIPFAALRILPFAVGVWIGGAAYIDNCLAS